MAGLPYHPHIQHVEPRDTYWYLTAAPELLELAAQRLEPAIEECTDELARSHS